MGMRRVALGALAAAIMVVAPLSAAQAVPPSGGCPSGKWQVSIFPLNWELGDPMDPTGDNLLLQLGMAGTIEEFGSLEAGLEAFGFDSFEELYAAAVDPGYNKIDKNDDGVLCFKTHPEQGGQPAYIANAIDNAAHS